MIAVFAAAILSSPMLVPALALLLGLGVLLGGFLRLGKQRFSATPAPRIDCVTPGQVEVHGKATGPYSITAPLTGKKCYVYRTTVWQQQASTDGWQKLADETLHVPFFLDDSTGKLLIEPMGADLDVPLSLREEYGGSVFSESNALPPGVSAFLARHRATPADRLLVEELCIEPQVELFVTGTVTENPGIEVRPLVPRKGKEFVPNGGPDTQGQPIAPEVVRLSDTSSPLVTDTMTQQSRIAAALVKAGIQNPNAWEAAGVPYSDKALEGAGPTPPGEASPAVPRPKAPEIVAGFNLNPALAMMKGPGNMPFAISIRRPQPAQSGRWQEAVLLGFGSALTLASLWVFLKNLR